jgi:intron-binding protein aquarius
VLQFQRLLFRYWPPLKDIALTNCANARKPETLHAALVTLPPADLRRLVSTQLRLVAAEDSDVDDAAYLRAAVVTRYSPTPRPKTAIAAMPLYPTETLLWDEHQIPDIHYTGEACLALPKLNLQFLTFWDYLLRNFHLFRLEAAYEIREDVGDVLKVCCLHYRLLCLVRTVPAGLIHACSPLQRPRGGPPTFHQDLSSVTLCKKQIHTNGGTSFT